MKDFLYPRIEHVGRALLVEAAEGAGARGSPLVLGLAALQGLHFTRLFPSPGKQLVFVRRPYAILTKSSVRAQAARPDGVAVLAVGRASVRGRRADRLRRAPLRQHLQHHRRPRSAGGSLRLRSASLGGIMCRAYQRLFCLTAACRHLQWQHRETGAWRSAAASCLRYAATTFLYATCAALG